MNEKKLKARDFITIGIFTAILWVVQMVIMYLGFLSPFIVAGYYRHMREVAELLKRLAAEGKTIFVSTHDPELIALCCDKIIRITEGRAQEVG